MSLARIAFAFTCLIHPVAYGQGLPDQSTNTVRTLKPNKDPLDTIDLDFTAKTIETLRKVKDELKASFGESAVLNAKEAKALELAFLQEELALKVPEILEESSTSDKSDQKDQTASTEEEITEIYKLYLEALKMTVATTLMNKASTALLTKLQGKAPFVLTIEFLSRLIQTGDRALIKDKLKPEVFAALSKQDQDRFVISLKMILNVSSAQPDLL
jgi:predicted nucleic acid-binding protein